VQKKAGLHGNRSWRLARVVAARVAAARRERQEQARAGRGSGGAGVRAARGTV
jgi:hypothetical protein